MMKKKMKNPKKQKKLLIKKDIEGNGKRSHNIKNQKVMKMKRMKMMMSQKLKKIHTNIQGKM
jgi:hypothetical protein